MPPATTDSPPFATAFEVVTDHKPMRWQQRLFDLLRRGCIPDAVDLPTGLGKTSIMAIWLLARAFRDAGSVLPRRLVYVVDRRVVVDQATAEAERISTALSQDDPVAGELRSRLGLQPEPGRSILPISTLRGGRADDREWTYDAAAIAIVIGTIDMIGSRLLFSGYRMSQWSRSMQAGLIGVDSLIVLDEAHLSPAFCEAIPRALQLQVSMSGVNEVPAARFLPLSATLGRVDGFDQDKGAGKRDEGGEVLRRLLAAQGDAFEALELADAVLDPGALAMDGDLRDVCGAARRLSLAGSTAIASAWTRQEIFGLSQSGSARPLSRGSKRRQHLFEAPISRGANSSIRGRGMMRAFWSGRAATDGASIVGAVRISDARGSRPLPVR